MKVSKLQSACIGLVTCAALLTASLHTSTIQAQESSSQDAKVEVRQANLLRVPKNIPQELFFDTGITIHYPTEGVKGIYAQAIYAEESLDYIVELMNTTDLNSVVLDVRDDYGRISIDLPLQLSASQENVVEMISDRQQLLKTFEKHSIYPIARIVAFKDPRLAMQRPDLSFRYSDGTVWTNDNGEAFINPFLKENWEYAVDVAIAAAKVGFKEIQLDYVRFPEDFGNIADDLYYSKGDYGHIKDEEEARIAAVTDFVVYAREQLKSYGVRLSVDVFGYTATVGEDASIGQNFQKLASHVDVISSMIYPSHWGLEYFNIIRPDLHPYDTVLAYMEIENELLSQVNPAPISRPWLQDFTATYLGYGNYQVYDAEQVSDQIRALKDAGVEEYLLWNALTTYSEGVEY